MKKEQKIEALCQELDKRDREIQSSLGLGIDDFKKEEWRSLQIEFRPEAALNFSAWITHKFAEYISHTVQEEGFYDVLFCVKKSKDISQEALEISEQKRAELQEFYGSEMEKIQAEFPELEEGKKEFEEMAAAHLEAIEEMYKNEVN